MIGDPVGSCELAAKEDYDKAAEVVLAGAQATNPGCIERDEGRRQMIDGVDSSPYFEPDKTMVCGRPPRRAPGSPTASSSTRSRRPGTACAPRASSTCRTWSYLSPVAERELWRYLVEVDLVAKVEVGTDEASDRRAAPSPTAATRRPSATGTTSGPASSTCRLR